MDKNSKKVIALIIIICLGILRFWFWQPIIGELPDYIIRELALHRQSVGAIPLLFNLNLDHYFITGLFGTILIPVLWFGLVRKNNWSSGWFGLIILMFSPWLVQSAASPLSVTSLALILLGWNLKNFVQIVVLILAGWVFPPFWPGVITSAYIKGWRKILAILIAAMLVRFNELHFWYLNKAYYMEIGFTSRINELRGYILDDLGSGLISRIISAALFNKFTWLFWTFSQRIFIGLDTYWWYGVSRHEIEITIKSLPRFNLGEIVILAIGINRLIKSDFVKSSIIFLVICIPVALPLTIQPSRDFMMFLPIYALVCDWGWERLKNWYLKIGFVLIWLYFTISSWMLLINFNFYHV